MQVRLISEFVSYGTTSLLEDTLLEIIQPDLSQARSALEVSLIAASCLRLGPQPENSLHSCLEAFGIFET